MADNTTRVLNLTPFRLRGLEPFKPVDVPSGTHMFFDEAGGSLSGVQLGEPEGNLGQRQSEFIIVPELIMTRIVRSQFGMQGSMPYLAMNVQNNSGRFVNTYLV